MLFNDIDFKGFLGECRNIQPMRNFRCLGVLVFIFEHLLEYVITLGKWRLLGQFC